MQPWENFPSHAKKCSLWCICQLLCHICDHCLLSCLIAIKSLILSPHLILLWSYQQKLTHQAPCGFIYIFILNVFCCWNEFNCTQCCSLFLCFSYLFIKPQDFVLHFFSLFFQVFLVLSCCLSICEGIKKKKKNPINTKSWTSEFLNFFCLKQEAQIFSYGD